ncbi:MAG: LysM peptidoglycan-binding domain-containing protein [Proteobacteria bacterium]|nr:LysM peptidoglycan-binding domain-containing protein [Pseudomonadota bacterium]
MTEATRQPAGDTARSGRVYTVLALVAVGVIGAGGAYLYETSHAPLAGTHTASAPAVPPPSVQAPSVQQGSDQRATAAPAPSPPKPAELATVQKATPADVKPAAPGVDVVRLDKDGSLVMAGSAQPGETLTIHSGMTLLGSAKADAGGQWVFLPDAPLPAGVHELSVADQAANPKGRTAQTTVLLSLPGSGGGAATASVAGSKLSSGPMVVLSQGNAPPRLLLAPPGSHPGPVGLDVVQYDDQGRIRFTGHAKPGRVVRLYVDNRVLGDAVADGKGIWSLSPKHDMPPGIYRMRTDELAPSGKVVARAEVPFARASVKQLLAPGQAVVQPGDCLWTIARHSYGRGVEYTAIFQDNLDQIRDPDRIYPGQAFHMPTADEAAHAPPISAVKTLLRNQRQGQS